MIDETNATTLTTSGRAKDIPRNLGRVAKEMGTLRDGSSGGSHRPQEALGLTRELKGSRNPRKMLEKIGHPDSLGKGIDYRNLSARSMRARERRWGVCHSETEFNKNMQVWRGQMDQWYKNLNPETQANLAKILNNLGIKGQTMTTDEGGRQNSYDWNSLYQKLFPDGKADIKAFIQAVKSVDGFRSALPVAIELSGVFGAEVRTALFEKKSARKAEHARIIREAKTEGRIKKEELENQSGKAWNNHVDQKKAVVEKAFKNSEIDERKREKYLKYLDDFRTDNERVINFNGTTFEGFDAGQTEEIKNAMQMLPQELIYNIKKVKLLSMQEMRGGAMCYFPVKKYKEGFVGISPDIFAYDEATFAKKVLHEIGGHSLRDMVHALNPRLHKQLIDLWSQTVAQNPGLLAKDTYSRDIINGTIRKDGFGYKDHLRYGNLIYASVDEFWSDRMAEYFYAKAMDNQNSGRRVYSNRDITDPFTQAEEKIVNQVCEQTYQIWRQTVEMANLITKPKLPEKKAGVESKVKPSVLTDIVAQFERNGYYEGNIPDGIFARSKGNGAFNVPILIDRNHDLILKEMLQKARSLKDQLKNQPEGERYMRLLQLVDSYTTSSDDDNNKNTPPTWIKVRDFVSRYLRVAGNKIDDVPVLLGQFTIKGQAGGGTCVPRALLVQILGSEMGLKPRLYKGRLVKRHHVEGDGDGSHMWNMMPNMNLVLESYRAKNHRSTFAGYEEHHWTRPKDDPKVRMQYYDIHGRLIAAV